MRLYNEPLKSCASSIRGLRRNTHFLEQVFGIVDLVHGPEHEPAVDMDRSVCLAVIPPIRDDPIQRSIESQPDELTPGIQRRRPAIAIGDIYR